MYLHVFFATILLIFYILELIDKYYFSYFFYSMLKGLLLNNCCELCEFDDNKKK